MKNKTIEQTWTSSKEHRNNKQNYIEKNNKKHEQPEKKWTTKKKNRKNMNKTWQKKQKKTLNSIQIRRCSHLCQKRPPPLAPQHGRQARRAATAGGFLVWRAYGKKKKKTSFESGLS